MTPRLVADDDLYRAVVAAEDTLRAIRLRLEQVRRAGRDLAGELEAALGDGPMTTPELGEAIHARHSAIRAVLHDNPGRFRCVQNVPSRSPRAKCWVSRSVASPTRPGTPDESSETGGA